MQKSYLPGDLIREIRKRKGFRQSSIHNSSLSSAGSQVTLSRIENLHQDPSQSTLADSLSIVDLPYERFFCPYMENQSAESFVLRRQITYLLDRAERDENAQALARELIDRLKSNLDMDSLINKQLWISLKTKLDVLDGSADDKTRSLILEGLRITYPEFEENVFESEILIFYECDLILNLARYHAAAGRAGDTGDTGDTGSAGSNAGAERTLAILARVRAGYLKQPVSEMYKEVLLGEIHNLIVKYLLEKGDYSAALEASEEAIAVTKRQTGSSQLPNSVYLQALALFHANGDKEKSLALLQQAYFAYALLKMEVMQERALAAAKEIAQTGFDTHGADMIKPELPRDFFSFKTGNALAVDNIGALLRQFRLEAGASQAEICEGICSRSFYSRIERGERTNISFFILEALMQRLGRDMSLYVDYFSSMDEWEESRFRMQYLRELAIGNADEARETLAKLTAVGDFSKGLGKQFLLFSQAILKGASGEYDDYLALLYEAINKTIPGYSDDAVANMRLTFNECNIINAIANHYAENGEVERGIGIYLGIRESMNKYYVDDSIKVRYYLTLLSNLTLEHYNTRQYEKALAFANESESMCELHGALFLINGIAHLKALCLYELGRKEEAAAYAAMAYYSGNLTAGEAELRELYNFAQEKLGIAFSNEPGIVFYKEKANIYSGL